MLLRQDQRGLLIIHDVVSAVSQIVGVVYMRQRPVLVTVAEVCDATDVTTATPAARGGRVKHSNVRTTTTTTAGGAAAIPVICRTSQGFR